MLALTEAIRLKSTARVNCSRGPPPAVHLSLAFHAYRTSTISPISHNRLVTPAAIAGVVRSVLCNFTKLYVFLRQPAEDVRRRQLVTITERVAARRDPTSFWNWPELGRADVIVSGDADLLVLDTFRGIPIITPAAVGRAQIP